jgi:hypothetical protein
MSDPDGYLYGGQSCETKKEIVVGTRSFREMTAVIDSTGYDDISGKGQWPSVPDDSRQSRPRLFGTDARRRVNPGLRPS